MKTSLLPLRADELAYLADIVEKKWESLHPNWTLDYISLADFRILIDDFSTNIGVSLSQRGNGKTITHELKDLDREIKKNIKFIKIYLELWAKRKNPTEWYSSFGIENMGRNGGWTIPENRQARLRALDLLANSCGEKGFTGQGYDFGEDYWKDIRDRYQKLSEQASDHKTIKAGTIQDKRAQDKQIREILVSVIHLIKANNPKNYRAKLRQMGFQKETY